jgi:hypothetical protein
VGRKKYIKPLISKVDIDFMITIQMQTMQPMDPMVMPRGGTQSPSNSPSPFQSPFGDKPFG